MSAPKTEKKYRNTLRKSLFAGSLVFVLFISSVLGCVGFMIYRHDMINRYQNYARDSIDFMARCVDGDDMEKCIKTGKKSKKYRKLQRLANDFKETHDLVYIYIIKPLKKDPPDNMMDVFTAYTSWGKEDGTDGLTDLGNLTGDAYPADVAVEYMKRMNRDPAITFFRNDTEFGKIYTAIRPVFNTKGKAIAVLCGDIMIDDINSAAISYATASALVTVLLGALVIFLMNFWLGHRIVKPVSRLEAVAGAFEDKCRQRADVSELTMEDPNIHTGDEIELLANSIISMVEDVQDYAKDIAAKENEISSMKEYVNQLDVLAYRDTLTGCGNKAAYEKAVRRLEWDMIAEIAEFAIVMADLNYLKKINDNYGHDKGNEYIKNTYDIIHGVFVNSPIFRIGGDEFLIIAQDEEMRQCEELVGRARSIMKKSMQNSLRNPWERISTAFGIAFYEERYDRHVEDVFKRADESMYENKRLMHAERE